MRPGEIVSWEDAGTFTLQDDFEEVFRAAAGTTQTLDNEHGTFRLIVRHLASSGAMAPAAAVVSDPGPDGVWTEGETVEAEVTFTHAVTVEGGPLALIADGSVRRAGYAGGSGTKTLTFAYRVTEADGALSDVRVAASGIALNGATVRGGNGADANLAFGEAPGVTAVSIANPGDRRFDAGDAVEVEVRFAEPVTVDEASGTPALTVVLARRGGVCGRLGDGHPDVRLHAQRGRRRAHGAARAGEQPFGKRQVHREHRRRVRGTARARRGGARAHRPVLALGGGRARGGRRQCGIHGLLE